MPYIKQPDREFWDKDLEDLLDSIRENGAFSGDLNYIITTIIQAWLGPHPEYGTYNSAIGVLECAKLELYRRDIAQYEEQKILENGDLP